MHVYFTIPIFFIHLFYLNSNFNFTLQIENTYLQR